MTDTHPRSKRLDSTAFMLADVEVRPDSLELVVAGEPRRVEPRVMELLVYGSQRAGQLLSRQQIMEDVWGGTHLVPETLQRVVSLLRKTLGDRREEPVFIETISSKGYRFLREPKSLTRPGAEDIKLTEKSVRSSPLFLIIAATVIVILTWLIASQFSSEEAWAPRADGSPADQTVDRAPVPPAEQ